MQKTKVCKGCREQRPIAKFDGDRSYKSGFKSKCKDCRRKERIARQEEEALSWDRDVIRIRRIIRGEHVSCSN